MTDVLERRIEQLEARVAALEGRHESGKNSQLNPAKKTYAGPRGGVRLLINQDFFITKRRLGEVREQLVDNGYHYARQSVHEALTALAKPNGPLVALKDGAGKAYVNRK